MNAQPHEILDDVAVYALGALPASEVRRVREHLASCPECRGEYVRLKSAAAAIGLSAETTGDAATCPSTLLKPRVMQKVRAESASREPAVRRPERALAWPAYLVAAACLAIAIVSSIGNIVLTGQLKQAQAQLTRESERASSLARSLAETRTTLSDVLNGGAKHYAVNAGEIITHGGRVYIALHELPEPPHGKVYQAWTLPKGAKRVVPSLTFVPDSHGVAVVALPVDARSIAAVAVSVEPEGGSKQPTTKPIVVVPLT